MRVSLADVSPSLALAIGRQGAAELGRLAILPVIDIREGARTPDTRAVALAVIDGLAVSERRSMAGPGDVIAELAAAWTACTAVRMAVIGEEFAAAASEHPTVIAVLKARARHRPAEPVAGGALDARVLGLLWRVAGWWGQAGGPAMTVQLPLAAPGLACLVRTSEPEVAEAVAALTARGAIAPRAGGGWELAGAEPGHRRDALRARGAEQLALARQVVEDYATLTERVAQELGASAARRSR